MTDKTPEEQLEEALFIISPSVYKIVMVLRQTGIQPELLCRVIRGVYNIQNGTGYGKVVIEIKDKVVYMVENTEKDKDF